MQHVVEFERDVIAVSPHDEEESIQITQLEERTRALSEQSTDRVDDDFNQMNGTPSNSFKDLHSEVPETVPPLREIHTHIAASDPIPSDGPLHEAKSYPQEHISDSTQPISQSFYTTLIRKSKSHSLPEDEDQETQRTLEEGDQGHIDITSSFVTGKPDDEDELQDSELVDFSPTQSQHRLTQFPESERFKTPATTRRKRNYKGELIESPLLSRNPLNGDAPTPANLVGLSQVFAGTQAASSPFSNGLPTGPRSDRPSPNIEMQIKAASAVDSSPLRPISAFQRAVTEPATRYVSVKQSQAVRDREIHPTLVDDLDEEEDFFTEETSDVQRMKRHKARRDRIHDQLQRLSSPMLAQDEVVQTDSSTRPATHAGNIEYASAAIAEVDNDGRTRSDGIESEAETEAEEIVDVEKTQPHTSDIDEEDKENQSVNVPRTATANRLHNYINGSISEIDASPLARQFVHPSQIVMMHSSAFQDVPNSQPGDERRKTLEGRLSHESSAEHGLEDGQQQTVIPGSGHQSDNRNTNKPSAMSNRPPSVTSGNSAQVPVSSETGMSAPNTVAETDSEGRVGRSESTKSIVNTINTTTDTTRYATALTHDQGGDDMSSQPISKTPPGTRRRRLMDISAEESPMKSTPSFNAQQALLIDGDDGAADLFIATSPNPRFPESPTNLADTSAPHSLTKAMGHGNKVGKPLRDIKGLESSESGVSPTRRARPARCDVQSPLPDAAAQPRHSIWDLDESPMKSAPKANERKKVPRTAKHVSRIEDRLNPTPLSSSSSAPITSDHVSKPASAASKDTIVAATIGTDEAAVAPNMVFACFNGKVRAYYPALCLGLAGSDTRKYQIQWEGYEPDEVDFHGVSSLDLRVGDAIKVNLQTFSKMPYIVQGFKDKVETHGSDITDIRGHRTLIVTPKQRKSLPAHPEQTASMEVPVKAIYLDNNMWVQMKKRYFHFDPSTAIDVSERLATPTDRPATPSTPFSRRRPQAFSTISGRNTKGDGLFANMAFAVSYDDTTRKNSLVELIQEQNGVILANSFEELLKPDKVELLDQYAGLGFTVLLTEAYSRKEKYMQALALGLPCLSGTWVEACLKAHKLVDWQIYLLPAGESTELDGAARSRVMTFFDVSNIKLVDMIDQRHKLLAGASIIIVVGRGKAEARWTKYAFLIRALGATNITKVTDAKAAQSLIASGVDSRWVFVDDKDVPTTRDILQSQQPSRKRSKTAATQEHGLNCRVVGQELLVQSLILGQLSSDGLV